MRVLKTSWTLMLLARSVYFRNQLGIIDSQMLELRWWTPIKDRNNKLCLVKISTMPIRVVRASPILTACSKMIHHNPRISMVTDPIFKIISTITSIITTVVLSQRTPPQVITVGSNSNWNRLRVLRFRSHPSGWRTEVRREKLRVGNLRREGEERELAK